MVSLAICSMGGPVFADSHGKFPGKGSVDAYNKSVDIADKAVSCANSGDYLTAIKYDREANSIYPYDSATYHNLGIHLAKAGSVDEARKAEEQAIALEPSFVGAWIRLGRTYEKQHKLTDAERCYRKANEINACYETLEDLGDILRQQGRFDEAQKYLLRAKSCPEEAKYGYASKYLELCRQQSKAASN